MITFFCPRAFTCIFLPWASTFGIRQTLATLRLREIVFDCFEFIVDLVWSLPGIKTLEITECSWVGTRHPLDPMNYPGRCAHLPELKLSKWPRCWVCLPVPSSRSSRCHHSTSRPVRVITHACDICQFNRARPHLRRRRPRLGGGGFVPRPTRGLQFLSVIHWYAYEEDREATAECIDLGLDDLLSTSHHSALRRLTVYFLCESTKNDVDEYETWKNDVKAAFPKSCKRGIVVLDIYHVVRVRPRLPPWIPRCHPHEPMTYFERLQRLGNW
ncbi:hypothetical protein OH76DRAFT_836684 [Lentinus brumalis]|uniref:F-box domain-containing protein n=1 Tax=Lentinus brumalis TaxID=2498619 RepID=A0A371D206_9APHY|nr:hypothetical protein OH76DRAFT_836684 [Polyporus brumalis]